jgi:hypothetical protein
MKCLSATLLARADAGGFLLAKRSIDYGMLRVLHLQPRVKIVEK